MRQETREEKQTYPETHGTAAMFQAGARKQRYKMNWCMKDQDEVNFILLP